jgi:hypothetical protein
MPGTAWSDPIVTGEYNTYITEMVMEAMNEKGPFVMIGSMDDGHLRIYQYALDHPENVKAIIPVNFYNGTEYTDAMVVDGLSYEEALDMGKKTSFQRMIFGDIYNFFGVSFGIIELFIKPDPLYAPADRALENTFLNLYNEKQWVTNCHWLYNMYINPETQMRYNIFTTKPDLDMSVPILGYVLGQNNDQLNQNCLDYGYTIDSTSCENYKQKYYNQISFNEEVVARNPSSKLIICDDCYAPYGNGFIINQYSNIPWFATTMMNELTESYKL